MNRPAVALWSLALMSAIVVGCGGGGGGGGSSSSSTAPATCSGPCPPKSAALTVSDVQTVLAQAVQEGTARGAPATIAVVDRVGNVLAVFEMNGAADSITINGATGPNGSSAASGGLDGVTLGGSGVAVPGPAFAAISMAITAAYFSSEGNAFSTRTAGQIIQEHFNPQVNNTPAGPLFGVQFSQITCSDVSRKATDGSVGPKRAPLGFAANPGGLPLYKNGTVVGAIGVMAGTDYTVDRDVSDSIPTDGELIAVAGTYGYAAPEDIRANRITADENFLRFTNSDQTMSNPASAPPFAEIGDDGALVAVNGYASAAVVAGTTYGSAASGIRADTTAAFAGTGAYVLVDAAGTPRFPPIDSTDGGMTQAEVTQILKSALEVANRARSQIRRPLGLSAQVSAVVVDTNGEILGHVRSPDALVDSADVVVQKARTAAFFSNPAAASDLLALPAAQYVSPAVASPIAPYVSAAQTLLGSGAFSNGIAYSSRSVGNISAPYFPDGIENKPPGPFSKTLPPWSIFNNGLALDLVYNQLVAALGVVTTPNCTGNDRIRNGITLFGGGFPIYRGDQLVGGIGVSGDGTLQSDLIGFVGIANAGNVLKTGIGNAPKNIRANTVDLIGTDLKLIYAKCPVAPYLDSTASNVCDDL
jgi:uncharacterized protein GlcG (DUF336 family)